VKEKPGPFAQVALAKALLERGTPVQEWIDRAFRRKPETHERVTKAELAAMPVSGVTH
jgi:hypothetical protein